MTTPERCCTSPADCTLDGRCVDVGLHVYDANDIHVADCLWGSQPYDPNYNQDHLRYWMRQNEDRLWHLDVSAQGATVFARCGEMAITNGIIIQRTVDVGDTASYLTDTLCATCRRMQLRDELRRTDWRVLAWFALGCAVTGAAVAAWWVLWMGRWHV